MTCSVEVHKILLWCFNAKFNAISEFRLIFSRSGQKNKCDGIWQNPEITGKRKNMWKVIILLQLSFY